MHLHSLRCFSSFSSPLVPNVIAELASFATVKMVAGGRKSHAAVSGSEDTLRSHISNFDNEWCVNMRNDIHLSHMCPSVLLADRVRETRCPLGQFPCGNMTECLPQVLQCNGHKDCPNGADERGCGESMHPDTEDTARFSAVLPGKARFSHVQIVTALKVMRWNQVLCILGIFSFFFGELLHIWKMCGAAHSSVHAHTNTHEQICTYACTHTHTHWFTCLLVEHGSLYCFFWNDQKRKYDNGSMFFAWEIMQVFIPAGVCLSVC